MGTVTENIARYEYNTLGTDFKVESVAANLLKHYDAEANIFISRVGNNDRPYLKDIKNIFTNSYGLDEDTIIIESYREGLYDYLPEGLFHPPSLGSHSGNVDSVVKEIRHQKEVEGSARAFFRPFEMEFFYTEVAALLKEIQFDVSDNSGLVIDTVSELWPLLKQVEPGTAKTLVHILPFLHEVRGDSRWIERFLSAFLNMETKITFVPNIIAGGEKENGETRLGEACLGLSLIPAGEHMDGERNWLVSIGPIPYTEIHKFIPSHPFRLLIQNIYDYLMPISAKIFENFITEKNEESFTLAEGSGNRLGFSTFI